MRAVVSPALDGFDDVEIGELPEPKVRPGHLVIDVEMAALNFADLLMMRGLYQYPIEPPFAPGMELVGTVAEVGDGVHDFAVGDRVAGMTFFGALAEKCLVQERQVVSVPDDISTPTAAALTIAYGTSYHALKQRAGLAPGETLLVLGAAGGVGSAAVDLGSAMGATVIAAASSAEKLAFAQQLGATHLIDYRKDDLRKSIRDITGGEGVDVVYDPVGGPLSEPAFRSLRWRGRHLVVGFTAGEIPSIPMNLPLLKGSSLVGVFWGTFTADETEEHRVNAVELYEMARHGVITPGIAATLGLEDAREGFRMISDREVMGRVLVSVAS